MTAGVASGDLAHLREDGLRVVLLGVMAGLYLWVGALYLSSTGFGPLFAAPILAGVGVATALASRKRSLAAAGAALIGGLAAADLCVMWLVGMRVAPYLLAIVVSLTALLFGLQAVAAVSLAAGTLVILIGTLRYGYPISSPELLGPVLVTSAVGILSALSLRNLYTALYWAWDRTMAAQRNEKELRERRGELARTAKALDEACQRLEHLNYDLAQARAAAEEARLVKQQFTTNVSHELRTPLNVIVAFAEMMYLSPESYGGAPLPAEYLGDVREIYRASQSLLRLIDDVLDLSQVEAHRLQLHCEPADLTEVVGEAVEIIRPLVRGKEVEVTSEVPPGLPRIHMDRARVRQVLLNLLNNARRFTQHGRITVSATREDGEVRITVADTGLGIAPADHERVFEEFRQLDGSTTRKRDGTGLGLAISKRFVALHGGRIWLESAGIPGKGSRFHFTLPLAGVPGGPAPELQRTPLALRPAPERGHALLLLDTDRAAGRLLEEALVGYRIVPAGDGDDLQALLAQERPLAAIVNTADPGAMHRARVALAGRDLAVIACPLVCERRLGQALGVVDYLVKPVSRQTLAAVLQKLPDPIQAVLVVDDDARMTRVLQRMVRALRPQCEVRCAYNGAAALREMRRRPPDLVLLDLVMPEMDGTTVLARVHADPALASIPIVVISAQELTGAEVRRLGRRSFRVSQPGGLSNEEALAYLRGALEVLGRPSAGRLDQELQRLQQISLSHGLAQAAGGAQ